MPREQLFLTPLTAFDLPAINEFITQLNQRMTVIQESLSRLEGLDNLTPAFSNDIDLQAHKILNIKQISFSDPIVVGDISPLLLTPPGDAPASATALRDDIATRTLPTINKALDTLRTQMNVLLRRLR
jgi:hypothetical protein